MNRIALNLAYRPEGKLKHPKNEEWIAPGYYPIDFSIPEYFFQ
jgi:hypothetical protein